MKTPRIASLLASGTEIVCGLGLRDQLVAISHECDYPADVTVLPRITSANIRSEQSSRNIDEQVREMCAEGAPLYRIDEKRLCELSPDVIITQAQCDVCAVRFEDVQRVVARTPGMQGCRIVPLNPTRLEHLYADIRRVAEACEVDARSESYESALRGRVEVVARRADGAVQESGRPRVACIEWIEPMMIAANWMPDLIDLAGGRCDLTKPGDHSRVTEWAVVRAFDPELIVIMPCGFDLDRAVGESSVLHRMAGWGELTAVRSRRVFAVDGNALFNRSGPRMVDSLELLAGLIHPAQLGTRLEQHRRSWRQLELGSA